MTMVYVTIASTTLRNELKACFAGCNYFAIASFMRVARTVSTSLKEISNREIGLTSNLFVGCIIGPTPCVFSSSHTLNCFVNIGVFLFRRHMFTNGSIKRAWASGEA